MPFARQRRKGQGMEVQQIRDPRSQIRDFMVPSFLKLKTLRNPLEGVWG